MNYRQRMRFAAFAAVLVHLLLLLPWSPQRAALGPLAPEEDDPITLNLQPETPATRQLIDVSQPTEAPPEASDLIAEDNTQAQDQSEAILPEELAGPLLEEIDEFDSLAQPPPMEEIVAEAAPEMLDESPVEEPVQEEAALAEEIALVEEALLEAEESEEEGVEERMQVAQAAVAQPEAAEAPRKTAGRRRSGAMMEGVKSFSALRHELAPYLKHVRSRVEQRWNAAIIGRYSGSSPRRVEVDCEIAADGTLVLVKAVGNPKDRVYAALCEEAIRKAGPFKPFPFQVPEMYRNKNLEIRWSFSFL